MNPFQPPESSTEYGECENPVCKKRLEITTLTLTACILAAYTLGMIVGYHSHAAYTSKLSPTLAAWQELEISPPEIDPETGDLKPLTEEEFGKLRDWLKRQREKSPANPSDSAENTDSPKRPMLRRLLLAAFGWFDAPNKLERIAWASLIIVPATLITLAWLGTRRAKRKQS